MRLVLALLGIVAVAVVAVGLTRGATHPKLFEPPALGGQPPGALVLAQQDRALAVKPLAGTTLLVATVFAPDGEGASGSTFAFAKNTRTRSRSPPTGRWRRP